MNYNEWKKLVNYTIAAVLLAVILYRLGSYAVYRYSDDYIDHQFKRCLSYYPEGLAYKRCVSINMFYDERAEYTQKSSHDERVRTEERKKQNEAIAKKRKEEEEERKRVHEMYVREAEELRKKVRDGTATEKEKQDLSTTEFMLELGF